MRLKELTFAFKSTNLLRFKNCYHHDSGISLITPLPLGEGRGGGAGCCVVVWLFGCFAFSVCKVNHDFLKTQHFSGYTSSKFCKDARNQLSHRKIAKVDYAREEEAPTSPLPPQQQDRETQRLTMGQKRLQSQNHKSQNHNKEFQYKKMKSHII